MAAEKTISHFNVKTVFLERKKKVLCKCLVIFQNITLCNSGATSTIFVTTNDSGNGRGWILNSVTSSDVL